MADSVADDVLETAKPIFDTSAKDYSSGDAGNLLQKIYIFKERPELLVTPCSASLETLIQDVENLTYVESNESFDSQMHSLSTSSTGLLQSTSFKKDFSALSIPETCPKILNCNEPPKSNTLHKLAEVLRQPKLCSTIVLVGKYKFRCHFPVLRLYAGYFQRVQQKLLIQLPPEHVTPRAFHDIYNWMVDIKKPTMCHNLFDLFNAAKFLCLEPVVALCWSTINNDNISENHAVKMYLETAECHLEELRGVMLSRICKFFLTFVASAEFVELEVEHLCQLLSLSSLGVNSEIEIFMSALRWLTHNWPERQAHLMELMRCVRFNLFPPLFLRFLQQEQQTCVLQHIVKNVELQDWINKSFLYASTELFGRDLHKGCENLMPLSFEEPLQRCWIYDRNCPYHHDFRCTQRHFFTYNQFLDYLSSLHETGPSYWQNVPLVKDLHNPNESQD